MANIPQLRAVLINDATRECSPIGPWFTSDLWAGSLSAVIGLQCSCRGQQESTKVSPIRLTKVHIGHSMNAWIQSLAVGYWPYTTNTQGALLLL
jgi:hypothetical protein